MPEFILPEEADHCPYCEEVLYWPLNCCEEMIEEYERDDFSCYEPNLDEIGM